MSVSTSVISDTVAKPKTKKQSKKKLEKGTYYRVNNSIHKTRPKNKNGLEFHIEYYKNKNLSVSKFLKSIVTSISSVNELKNIIYNIAAGMAIEKKLQGIKDLKILYCWVCLDDKLITYDLYPLHVKDDNPVSGRIINLVKDLGFVISVRDLYTSPELPFEKLSVTTL